MVSWLSFSQLQNVEFWLRALLRLPRVLQRMFCMVR
jgi:hypothetical protein